MKNVILFFMILLFMVNDAFPRSQRDQILIYNISLGGITGGVGSVINKKKNQTWYETFLKGFAQGSVGGLIQYQGKRIIYEIYKKKTLEYGWLAKIVHSTGASIVENAAANKNFWESWIMHFGFLRIETEPFNSSFRIKLLPVSALGFIDACFLGKFSLKKSLRLGAFYFATDTLIDNRAVGRSLYSSIVIDAGYSDKYKTIAHEYVHNLQFRDYLTLNNHFSFIDRKLKKNKLYRKLSNYIYFDTPFMYVAYIIEGKHSYEWKFKNFFEMEAEYFATLKEVPIPRKRESRSPSY